MDFVKSSAAAALCAALCGCAASPGSIASAQSACAAGARHAEVRDTGEVTRVLGFRDSRSGEHEGFILRVGGSTFKVETNAGITGPIPLNRGDRVTLQGQYECDDSVIHWTHHDPAFRHIGGYIEVHGTRYQ